MSITQILAKRLCGVNADSIPSVLSKKIKHCLIDYFAAAWAAQAEPLCAIYRGLSLELGGYGSCSVIGGGKTSAGFAAMANGCLSHIKEVDDLQRGSAMHVGITVVPPILALAELYGMDGRRFIESIVCGYEAAIRVGEALGKEHYAIFHTTGTAGTFGAAAAAAKYLGLDFQQTVDALGHAGTQAAGLWQFLSDGAVETKPLHPGKAAMNGLISALLAKRGVHGATNILEGPKGFGKIGAPNSDMSNAIKDLVGKDDASIPYKINEICFKSYPCCGQIHSMLDALKAIIKEHNIESKDISSVDIKAYQQAIDLTANPNPTNMSQARFSLPICMGHVLAKGDLNFADMTPSILTDEAVWQESKKIHLHFDKDIDALFPKTRPCLVTVTTNSGKSFEKKNLYRRGDPEKPLSDEEIENKFKSLTCNFLSPEVQNAMLNWIFNLEREKEIGKFLFSGTLGLQ